MPVRLIINQRGDGWETNTSSYDLNNSGVAQTGTDTFGSYTGHWIKLELPRKIVVSSIDINAYWNSSSQADDRRPDAGAFLGSNDDSTWELIHAFGSGTLSWSLSSSSSTTYETNISSMSASNTNAYKYIVFVITHKTYGGSPTVTTNKTSIRRLRYYGTEPEDVVARVGEGLDGKVANFRVYDKYLHEEQALELWDSQKDQFGRAESSVVVHKGRLGVGTTEPEGRFAVLDEAHESEEFPPRAMTATENYMEGHGVFRVSASSIVTGTNATENVFDKKSLGSNASFWLVGNGAGYNTTDGSYEGESGVIYQLSPETPTGQYITLEMPYRIKLEKYLFMPRYNTNYQTPKDWELWGSNDGNTWTKLHNVVGNTEYLKSVTYDSPQTNFYRYFGFIVTRTIMTGAPSGYDYMAISELKFFGTRERGQSTLHDGSLTLTKNLTVPRIGPALDADDTPRRDSLVVEYNTSTNPTANGTVKDTSGRGLDGLIRGSASYDATEKAFDIEASSDIITTGTNIGGVSGDFLASLSVWIKPGDVTSASSRVIFIHTSQYAVGSSFVLYMWEDEIVAGHGSTNNQYVNGVVNDINRWYHIVAIKKGTGTVSNDIYEIYINGVKQTLTTSAGTVVQNVGADQAIIVGSAREAGLNTEQFIGKISNLKYYPGTTLTATEVKRLYDMGRCDEGHHVVNFSKTRVGIGLGDGEAPQAALEVRGSAVVGNVGIGANPTAPLEIQFNDNVPTSPGVIFRDYGGNDYWSNWINNYNHFYFAYNGNNKGYILSTSTSASQMNFTGQHRTFIKDVPFTESINLEGLIVSSDQNKYIKMSGGIEAGSNAITTNESLPIVSLSTTTNDKKCFGVISASEDPEQRSDVYGSFVTPYEKEKGDTRVYINSVGEGAIWVVNTNGSLESGDYITTSNVTGYGQKQDGAGLMNYTVAKITMDCDFNPATQPVQRILRSNVVETHYTGLVPVVKSVPHEFVTTVVSVDDAWSNVSISPSDLTYAEWSNLEANVQNTYTLEYTSTSNVVYDVKYTKTTVSNVTESDPWDAVHVDPPTVTYAEYSNLEANVQNTYSLTYTMTTKVEATEAVYSNLSTEDKEFFVPTYYHTVEQTVDADYPGAVKHETVTDRLENDLDEHGQIQWEDHPTDTEKAYKVRFLDATGTETDEANCVHRAAFVGCTYHCG